VRHNNKMKSIPWRLIFGLVFIGGLGPALVMGFVVYGKTNDARLAVTLALAVAAVMAAALGVWYRGKMRHRDPGFSFADADANREMSMELAVPVGEAFDFAVAAVQLLPGFFPSRISRETRRIEGSTGAGESGVWTFGTPGERIKLVVGARGRTASYVRIASKPDSIWVLLDFGKNKQNISMIASRLNEHIANRFEAERAAKERAQMERALTDAKLAMLQAQIEPHFLYNTLANAQLLTRIDPKRADVMLGNLITYLRSGLPRAGESMSTLGREVERSRAYLEILKIRMGNRLNVEIDMPDDLAAVPFAPLLLQTLVENAIKHGLEPKTGGGVIRIHIAREADVLRVAVIDNGVGLRGDTSGTGLGLKNMRERLKLTYGEAADLSLRPNVPSGMCATITIPHPAIQSEA
jgi:signal transduction histidine kinase